MDQVNLPEIRLRRVATHARQMLHGGPEVRVSFYAEAGDKADGFAAWLREAVFVIAAHRDNACGCHHTIVPHGDFLIEECIAINERGSERAACPKGGPLGNAQRDAPWREQWGARRYGFTHEQ